jgi:hypothetical protein
MKPVLRGMEVDGSSESMPRLIPPCFGKSDRTPDIPPCDPETQEINYVFSVTIISKCNKRFIFVENQPVFHI